METKKPKTETEMSWQLLTPDWSTGLVLVSSHFRSHLLRHMWP